MNIIMNLASSWSFLWKKKLKYDGNNLLLCVEFNQIDGPVYIVCDLCDRKEF